ncbi:hypothetical protein Ae406Ps2_1841 [Pseudonocardia sp. Ae406_Ps2]|nr:hypothetical protein Ae406Ps2_1841 [Pseudonocardia sp. Ae406_Ps2]OLM06378.1 hypothetical protein Ae331Ps2_4088c [Pseudonocardia sp. Ae331_Ps2]OLM23412.1 hypothetical protein Ae706Ps2_1845 [Pseudonocardia sp. Ae706_Ps2]
MTRAELLRLVGIPLTASRSANGPDDRELIAWSGRRSGRHAAPARIADTTTFGGVGRFP